MATSGFNLALARGHFQVRGGRRNAVAMVAIYAVCLSAPIYATFRLAPADMQSYAMKAWTLGLLGLQAVTLMLLGANSVRSSLRKDITSQMLESHRLMPVAASWAVAGYVLAAAAQTLSLATVNFLLGLVTISLANHPNLSPANWMVANLVLLGTAVSFWFVVLYYTFLTRMGLGSILLVGIAIWISQGVLLAFAPGLIVLLSPLMQNTVVDVVDLGLLPASLVWDFKVGFLVQATLAGICFIAAQRKYLRSDSLSMGPLLGLALVAWWVLTSIWGLRNWTEIQPSFLGSGFPRNLIQDIIATVVAMLLACVPLAGAAWQAREYQRRKDAGDIDPPRRPVPMLALAVVLTAVLMALPWRIENHDAGTLVRTAIVFLCHMVSCGYVLRFAYRRGPKAALLMVAWIAVTWIGPFVIDLIRIHFTGVDELSGIGTASPIGSIVSLWGFEGRQSTPGLVFQAAAALCLAGAYHLLPRFWMATRPTRVLPALSASAGSEVTD